MPCPALSIAGTGLSFHPIGNAVHWYFFWYNVQLKAFCTGVLSVSTSPCHVNYITQVILFLSIACIFVQGCYQLALMNSMAFVF